MPATYAAIRRVLEEVAPRLRGVRSLLDLGGGPGTAMWAAAECFPSLERITTVERDPAMVALGRSLAMESEHAAVREAAWRVEDLGRTDPGGHDVVILAYVLAELSTAQAISLLRRTWPAAGSLVVVEPGTPAGFERILAARTFLLESGAGLIAPCPHQLQCPMAAAGDWCHFAQRVERTSLHRLAKGGSLGHEDEKFSYVAATRGDVALPRARIVRHPMKHPGHVQLTLCTEGQLQRETVAKSQKDRYRAARKAEWGDVWR
jgi:ribosomal protein RSM22 (predicted rRNA methylase)